MNDASTPMTRRHAIAAAAIALTACEPSREVTGALTGASADRGHLLWGLRSMPSPTNAGRVQVLIAGGGIAGLAAARALRQRGIEDLRILELEDVPGGNSRAGEVGGIACPLGAHYLPVPGDDAREVQDLLEELGLRRRVAGRWEYDELHLCHAPQERLFFRGLWQDGLLPAQGIGADTLAQYRRFAVLVDEASRGGRFTIPAPRVPPPSHRALDALTFSQWLTQNGLSDPHLRWYLDYCCRDDYGAGLSVVSAWAGIHYFASRHGFQPPGMQTTDRDAVLTWPEGNGWLVRRLSQPLGERVLTGRVVLRIEPGRHAVTVDTWNVTTRGVERWQAQHCIVALPLFVAARVVAASVVDSTALRAHAQQTRHAPWAVVNLHVREPLRDRGGAAPAWDNVIYGGEGLGYVDAGHQSLDPRPAPTVLSWYMAPGEAARAQLLARGWRDWQARAVAALSAPHPDLVEKLLHVEVARYGHAMAIPVPGALAQVAAGMPRIARLSFAHSDWAGYSIFEEAFTLGHGAGQQRV